MKLSNSRAQQIRFRDFAKFSDGYPEMKLADVINDVTREDYPNDFLGTPGALLYEIDLAIDMQAAMRLQVEALNIDFYTTSPARAFRPGTTSATSNETTPGRGQHMRNQRSEQEAFLAAAPVPFRTIKVDLGIPLPNTSFQFGAIAEAPLVQHLTFLASPPVTQGPLAAGAITADPTSARTGAQRNASSILAQNSRALEDSFNMMIAPRSEVPVLSERINRPPPEPPVFNLGSITERRSLKQTRAGLALQSEDFSAAANTLIAALSDQPSYSTSICLLYTSDAADE